MPAAVMPPESRTPSRDLIANLPTNRNTDMQHDTESTDLKEAPAVLELAAIQAALGLPDGDFARTVRFSYSGSSWGKIKCGTFSGSASKALRAVKTALASYRNGGDVEVLRGVVIFPHIRQALDAVTVARVSRDEHKLVIVCGDSGAGKSVTARLLGEEFGGHYLHAHPSWQGSYLRSLIGLARALGLSGMYRTSGEAETGVLAALACSPALLVIDEANHFSREFVNFLKTILNETACCLALFTLPGHLGRLSAVHAEESRQLLRRAVAIIHIPPVSSADVMALHAGLFSEITLGHAAPALASAANRMHRLDTVRRVFEETESEDAEDLPRAIERVEKSLKAVLQ